VRVMRFCACPMPFVKLRPAKTSAGEPFLFTFRALFMKQTYRATVRRLIYLCVFLASLSLHAQPGNDPLQQIWQNGLPFITNYTTADYKADLQNWGIIQDNQGLMYFANNSGILQFDGSSWRVIKTPGETAIRSFAKDSNGRIYVGGIGEVGYLEPDTRQGMVFHPLQQQLDSAYRDFGNVWFTYATGNAVYFVCDHYVLRWQEGVFHVTREPKYGSFGFSWLLRDKLYVDVTGHGLMAMEGDSLRVVKGGRDFLNRTVMGLLPMGKDRMIALTVDRHLLEYDGNGLMPFGDGKEMPLKDAAYNSIQLSNGDYALATTGSGIYIMDKNGVVTTNITKLEGLSSDAVYAVYQDAEGDIWLATDNGISRVETNSPLRVLNTYHGVDENPFDIEFFNNRLYITNSKGLFQLTEDRGAGLLSHVSFKKITGIDNITLGCHQLGDELLISSYDGLFTLDKNNKVKTIVKITIAEMESPSDPGQRHILFDMPFHGIWELYRTPEGEWKRRRGRLSIPEEAYSFARAANDNLFIYTHGNGVYEINWKEAGKEHRLSDPYTLVHHNPGNGLASLNVKAMGKIGRKVYISAVNTVQSYNEATHAFETDPVITGKIRQYQGAWVNEFVTGAGQQYWLSVYENFDSHIFKGNKESLEELAVSGRFSDVLTTKIYDSKKGIVLFGSNKSIVLYDERKPAVNENTFKTLIRSVAVSQDSVIYAGHFNAGAENTEIEIPYNSHDLRFHFSLPSYDLSAHTTYQHHLEGFSDEWSSWSTDVTVDFTNLTEGSYVFHVRGKNVYGQVSEEDLFAFVVLPPWYRTWWAYSFYVLLLVAIISLVASQRARKLKQEKIELERIILERTQTILQQTEELKEMDRLKSRFFANISHEFRTPLTLILSPLEEEISKRPAGRDSLMLIQRNANRLLELVNQLLDLSKLEAGKMQLQLRPGDLATFMRVMAASFDSMAQQKQINFVKTLDVPEGMYNYDADKLEKIIINLLANAFKFTGSHGQVTLAAYRQEHAGMQILAIQVTDTGMGIAPEEQEHIFESFYQSNEGHEGGTGLGLSLVKELVKLYRGTIALNSELGKGTAFLVKIPLDGDALPQDQANAQTPAIPERPLIGADPAEEEAQQSHERDTVLVVEDNADLRNYISSFLEREFTVVTAPNGKEGLDTARKVMPDLVLSDVMMPWMNGLQLTEKIKTDNVLSHIPVILLTAKSEHESKMEGLKIGADDYLTKPFSNEELLVRVRNLIVQRKKLAERYRERILVPVTQTDEASLDDKFLHRAKEVVEENLADVLFSVEKMADEIHLSRTQLLRKLKALTGLSPNEFIKDLRLKRAADMIRQKADTITQIGYAVGFNDQSYFTKCFKKQFGVTPTEYAHKVGA
jgi:signal transduction histidine kinase/DNA-binding response OmpR family regulator